MTQVIVFYKIVNSKYGGADGTDKNQKLTDLIIIFISNSILFPQRCPHKFFSLRLAFPLPDSDAQRSIGLSWKINHLPLTLSFTLLVIQVKACYFNVR